MAFCQQCGTQNPDGNRFCTGCGADLTAQAAPVSSNPAGYQQQPYGQAPQPFAQQGVPGYGVPAGLSKKEFLNLPTNSKIKGSIKAAAIIAPLITIVTIILNMVELEEYKASLRRTGYYLKDGYMSNYYILWGAMIISAILAIVAYVTLNIIPSIVSAISFLFAMIFALVKGAIVGWMGYMTIVLLIFMIYYLFILNKEYDKYRTQNGMNF